MARHADREGWVSAPDLLRETADARREKLLRDFVARDADAIAANLARKHALTSRVLDLADKHIGRLEKGELLRVGRGKATVTEDPILSLRRVALILQTVEGIDRALADLTNDAWRSAGRAAPSLE